MGTGRQDLFRKYLTKINWIVLIARFNRGSTWSFHWFLYYIIWLRAGSMARKWNEVIKIRTQTIVLFLLFSLSLSPSQPSILWLFLLYWLVDFVFMRRFYNANFRLHERLKSNSDHLHEYNRYSTSHQWMHDSVFFSLLFFSGCGVSFSTLCGLLFDRISKNQTKINNTLLCYE